MDPGTELNDDSLDIVVGPDGIPVRKKKKVRKKILKRTSTGPEEWVEEMVAAPETPSSMGGSSGSMHSVDVGVALSPGDVHDPLSLGNEIAKVAKIKKKIKRIRSRSDFIEDGVAVIAEEDAPTSSLIRTDPGLSERVSPPLVRRQSDNLVVRTLRPTTDPSHPATPSPLNPRRRPISLPPEAGKAEAANALRAHRELAPDDSMLEASGISMPSMPGSPGTPLDYSVRSRSPHSPIQVVTENGRRPSLQDAVRTISNARKVKRKVSSGPHIRVGAGAVYMALWPCVASHPMEMNLDKGEIAVGIDAVIGDWIFAQHARTGAQGYLPVSRLALCPCDPSAAPPAVAVLPEALRTHVPPKAALAAAAFASGKLKSSASTGSMRAESLASRANVDTLDLSRLDTSIMTEGGASVVSSSPTSGGRTPTTAKRSSPRTSPHHVRTPPRSHPTSPITPCAPIITTTAAPPSPPMVTTPTGLMLLPSPEEVTVPVTGLFMRRQPSGSIAGSEWTEVEDDEYERRMTLAAGNALANGTLTDKGLGVFKHDPCSDATVQDKILAAELGTLVRKVTQPDCQRDDLIDVILMTHSNFVESHVLLYLLIARFNSSPVGDAEQHFGGLRVPMQLKVISIISRWISSAYYDFLDALVLDLLLAFLSKPSADSLVADALDSLRREYTDAKDNFDPDQKICFDEVGDTDVKPSILLTASQLTSLAPLQMHAVEVARQLCVLDFTVFARIRPIELLKQKWNKDGAKKKAPNVLAVIDRFNRTCAWAASEVLSHDDCATRAQTICLLIDVASQLMMMQNFNSLMAVLSALESAPITRLQYTWELLPEEYKIMFKGLTDFMSMSRNYHTYREKMKHIKCPAVPHLGIYLQDLTFIDDGNPSMIGELINVEKEQMTYDVIQNILKCRAAIYKIHPVSTIIDYLVSYKLLDLDQQYKASLVAEPRNMKPPQRKDRKPIEYLAQEGNMQLEYALDSDFVEELTSHMATVSYSRGEYILREGDRNNQEMYFIGRGIVAVDLPDGRVFSYNQGEFFGEIALFFDRPRSASVWAQTDVDLFVLTKKLCDDLLRNYPVMQDQFKRVGEARLKSGELETPKWMRAVAKKSKMDEEDSGLAIPPEFLNSLIRKLALKVVSASATLFNEGDPGSDMFFIRKGIVDFALSGGRRFACTQGTFFGEIAMFLDKPRSASARAQTDVELMVLAKADCEEVLERYPKIKKEFKKLGQARFDTKQKSGKFHAPKWMQTLAEKCVQLDLAARPASLPGPASM